MTVVPNRQSTLQSTFCRYHIQKNKWTIGEWIKGCLFVLGCIMAIRLTLFPTQPYQTCPHSVDDLTNTPTDQNSPCLAQIVKQVLIPPSGLPYNLADDREHSHGQAQLIKKLFEGKVCYLYYCNPYTVDQKKVPYLGLIWCE